MKLMIKQNDYIKVEGFVIMVLRKEKGWSKQQLANKCNVVERTISRIENGLNFCKKDHELSVINIFNLSPTEFSFVVDNVCLCIQQKNISVEYALKQMPHQVKKEIDYYKKKMQLIL